VTDAEADRNGRTRVLGQDDDILPGAIQGLRQFPRYSVSLDPMDWLPRWKGEPENVPAPLL
jgi:hypothetical protein